MGNLVNILMSFQVVLVVLGVLAKRIIESDLSQELVDRF